MEETVRRRAKDRAFGQIDEIFERLADGGQPHARIECHPASDGQQAPGGGFVELGKLRNRELQSFLVGNDLRWNPP